jgi:UDP-glucose 4-epimerase
MDTKQLDFDHITFIHGDLRNRENVFRALKDVDYVFHEGAVSSSPMFEPDPRSGVDVNVMGGLNLLQASAEAGVDRLVYASTSSLYGDQPVPWREDMAIPFAPNAYAASKLAFEYLAKIYSKREQVETVGLRYFSIYGPGEESKGQYANMLSQFLWAIRKGEQPIVYGDGSQTRDFTYVDDVVRANLCALETKSVGEVFNVGTGRETAIIGLVQMLEDATGRSVEPRYVPNPIRNYVYRTMADTSRAERMLGFGAEVSLKEGISRLVNGGAEVRTDQRYLISNPSI